MFLLDSFRCAVTLFVVLLPRVHAVCTPDAFHLHADYSTGKQSQCYHLASVKVNVGTVEQCKKETCQRGGNTFNYKTNECFVKRCRDGNTKLTVMEGMLVYSLLPSCTDAPYTQLKKATDGLLSACETTSNVNALTAEACRQLMCEAGGNTFNFRPNQGRQNCGTKVCTSGQIPWTSDWGGYDVYTILPCFNKNGGCGQTCRDDGVMVTCSCRDGFTLQSDLKSCRVGSACDEGLHDCEHVCTETDGGYTCSCRDGYILGQDGKTCSAEIECGGVLKDCQHFCTETGGSYTCSCRDGYTLGQDGKTCTASQDRDQAVFPTWALITSAVVPVAVVLMILAIAITAVVITRRQTCATRSNEDNLGGGRSVGSPAAFAISVGPTTTHNAPAIYDEVNISDDYMHTVALGDAVKPAHDYGFCRADTTEGDTDYEALKDPKTCDGIEETQ